MFNQANLCVFFSIALCFSGYGHASSISMGGKYFSHIETSLKAKNGKNSTITIFNVKDNGAKGDGVTDDSKAFQQACMSACGVENGVLYIPENFTFLLQPIVFNGATCKFNLTVQVDGKVVAPSSIKDWKSIDGQWILFSGFTNGLIIRGKGVFDGRGEDWWKNAKSFLTYEEYLTRRNGNTMKQRPHAVMILASKHVIITGITILNSPQMHIFFGECEKVIIFDFTLLSPGDSPNTDGIHLSRTTEVDIHNSTLACGDDCISVQSGCHNVSITDVQCGPGHGYSLGSLGYNLQEAHVSNVNIYNSTTTNASNGVRIKTWEGATGTVHNITFENIAMKAVQNTIIIDQFYCNGHEFCNSTGSKNAIAISDVTFKNITGTYTKRSVALVCSPFVPCRNINMGIINLKPVPGQMPKGMEDTSCSNAYGKVLTETIPSLTYCLKSSGPEAPSPSPTKGIKEYRNMWLTSFKDSAKKMEQLEKHMRIED